ncbi:DUF3703 domain-containing protein [Nannocystis sp. SCPEA4]|uniref:DUF3703 domain-containing protein n=1 Tax=Nannocystis sp. SCPEA4 TaxID=2996787 RepID=UPI00226EB6E8|nr:DUF3703 domain-containing protein [Nannocystis sp. SCPEA4]MCY1057680.1 DUF3703 domain-containing protein [Nannocystis sp. SCPEA4]
MSLTASLRPAVHVELTAAHEARRRGDAEAVWRHLERAHILSQPSARLHTRVHWEMLRAALWPMDPRELVGQVVRVAVAGLGSALGRYPRGNTGRARVPIMAPMPIPADLERILHEATRTRRVPAST